MWECQKCFKLVQERELAPGEECPEGGLHEWKYFELAGGHEDEDLE